MQQTARAIVLRTIKYKDASLIADVYTDVLGRCQFMLRVPKSGRARVKPSLFQPLSVLELEADIKHNADIYRIQEAKSLLPYVSIPYDPYKQSIVMFLAEFLYRALREQEENRPLFEYLLNSLDFLDGCERSFSNFHLVFLIRLSRFLGIYPNLDSYHSGDYFDLLNACYTSSCPLTHQYYVSPALSAHIDTLMRMNYHTMHLFRMSRAERNQLLTYLNEYYRLHLPDFPELKSLQVLREVFD